MWILVVEDELSMGTLLKQGLEEANHTVTWARDGLEGIHAAESNGFDAIVTDVMMPGLDGIELVRRLRRSQRQIPVLMLTARDSAEDVIKGLDAGADDYLVKPFPFRILLARLRALSRRAAQPQIDVLQVDDLVLDPASHQVTRAGKVISLTETEYRLLEFLMRRPGRAVSRSTIIDGVWGFENDVEANTVDVFIRLLREKLDGDPQHRLIQTVRGYGYILREN